MSTFFKRCSTDDDFAKVSLFILERKHDIHQAYTTMDIVELVYSYVTEGHILQAIDESNQIMGAAAYYHGTTEKKFTDKEVAFVDIAIFDREHRGTRLFLNGLRFMVEHIMNEHPDVEELRLAALSENSYLCRLYSKFTTFTYSRESTLGEEIVFCGKINKISTILNKLSKV
ncbi:hypothetical protein FS935_07180 [Metabacillus litoralis]|uniref:N-acetyltransferase domain-containing protein n=1 Tax=Metabacillus litoralis TaxID=152268 RepID=A0A5C6W8N6_9BACI|nr:hypothetical protein [Metabacillus litoralis]TXC92156.1 hypothetical protein FS935_07180 [Metabacillus litoralis]